MAGHKEWANWARTEGSDYDLGYAAPRSTNSEAINVSPKHILPPGVGIAAAKAFDAITFFPRKAWHVLEGLRRTPEEPIQPVADDVENLMTALDRDNQEGASSRVGRAENALINTVTFAEAMRFSLDGNMTFHNTTPNGVRVVTVKKPGIPENDFRIEDDGHYLFYTLSRDGTMTRRNYENPTAVTDAQDANIRDVALAVLFTMYHRQPSYIGDPGFMDMRQRLERSINGYKPIQTVTAEGFRTGTPTLTCNIAIDGNPVNFFYRIKDQILFVQTPAGIFGIGKEGEFLMDGLGIVREGKARFYPINAGEDYDVDRQEFRRYTAYLLEGLEKIDPEAFERFADASRISIRGNGVNILLPTFKSRLYRSLARYHESGSDQLITQQRAVSNVL